MQILLLLFSNVWLFAAPWTTACKASLSYTISQSLLKLLSIELMMPSNHLVLRRPLLLLSSIFPSTRVFSNKTALCTRWPKYWSFSFSISPSNEYSGLISFRIDWIDLLAVQGTHKSLLQNYNSKASVLWRSAFFMVQLWYPQLPRSKHLLISWLQSPSGVISEGKKIKSVTVSIVYQSICHEVIGTDAMILVVWMLSFKPPFHSPFPPSSRGSLAPLCFLS